MYDSLTLANYFIRKARKDGGRVNALKLQKLVYIAHGWYLGNFGEPLIEEEVEAWDYGPVIPELYHRVKKYGAEPIRRPITVDRFESRPSPEEISDNDRPFLDKIWEVYGRMQPIRLSLITHKPGTPWSEAVEKYPEQAGHVTISDSVIEKYYRRRVEELRTQDVHE